MWGESTMAENCGICAASFATPSEYTNHLRSVHSSGAAPEQPIDSAAWRNLDMHCIHCRKGFLNLEELMTHELLPHTRMRSLFHLPPRAQVPRPEGGLSPGDDLLGSRRARPEGSRR
jgi:hypothetical protein